MKLKFLSVFLLFFFAFPFSGKSQTSAPSSTSQPSTTGSQKPSIPVVPVGDQVKPGKSEDKTTPTAQKSSVVPRIKSIPLELKETIYSRKSKKGDKVIFVVATDVPPRGNLIEKGTPVIGKITSIEKPRGGEAGQLKIALEKIVHSSGNSTPFIETLSLASGKDQSGSYAREVFMPTGTKQSVSVPSKLSFSGLRPPAGKLPAKRLSSKGQTEDLFIKVNEGKTPGKINIYIEPPKGLKISDLKDDPIQLVRVNDFNLMQPISSTSEKGRVGDNNQNGVEDLHYVFNGWELAKYLPEGKSRLSFLTSTKKGKPVETVVQVKMEFR